MENMVKKEIESGEYKVKVKIGYFQCLLRICQFKSRCRELPLTNQKLYKL